MLGAPRPERQVHNRDTPKQNLKLSRIQIHLAVTKIGISKYMQILRENRQQRGGMVGGSKGESTQHRHPENEKIFSPF